MFHPGWIRQLYPGVCCRAIIRSLPDHWYAVAEQGFAPDQRGRFTGKPRDIGSGWHARHFRVQREGFVAEINGLNPPVGRDIFPPAGAVDDKIAAVRSGQIMKRLVIQREAPEQDGAVFAKCRHNILFVK
jgi:hypothetical protein